jgi:hypothetical protein
MNLELGFPFEVLQHACMISMGWLNRLDRKGVYVVHIFDIMVFQNRARGFRSAPMADSISECNAFPFGEPVRNIVEGS